MAVGLFVASTQVALPATSRTVTVHDKVGDVMGPDKTGQRRSVDIRSVTVTRPDRMRLRVVIETVAPIGADMWITFRYSDQGGFDDRSISTYISRNGPVNKDKRTRRVYLSGGGKRLVLTLAVGPAGAVQWYPQFRWMVAVETAFLSDDVPSQSGALRQHPRFAFFE